MLPCPAAPSPLLAGHPASSGSAWSVPGTDPTGSARRPGRSAGTTPGTPMWPSASAAGRSRWLLSPQRSVSGRLPAGAGRAAPPPPAQAASAPRPSRRRQACSSTASRPAQPPFAACRAPAVQQQDAPTARTAQPPGMPSRPAASTLVPFLLRRRQVQPPSPPAASARSRCVAPAVPPSGPAPPRAAPQPAVSAGPLPPLPPPGGPPRAGRQMPHLRAVGVWVLGQGMAAPARLRLACSDLLVASGRCRPRRAAEAWPRAPTAEPAPLPALPPGALAQPAPAPPIRLPLRQQQVAAWPPRALAGSAPGCGCGGQAGTPNP
mmetsp:Transcript_51249/g.158980  ORF Transcript_51249/g.158980 Transcript_51249/m.158980 type:complete len:320 (-) Transcript_51249:336-1295(-)